MSDTVIRTLADIEHLEATPLSQRLQGLESTYDVFRRAAQRWPEQIALHFLPQGLADEAAVTFTYAELFAQITRTANLFHSLEVGTGDVVSYLLPNLPQTHFTLWGGQAAGIVNAINPLLESEQIAALLNEVSCKVLVTLGPSAGPELWHKVQPLLDKVPSLRAVLLVGEAQPPEGTLSFDAELQRQPAEQLLSGRQFSRDDLCAYFHTGGTTGMPKVAQHRHGNQLANACCGGLLVDLGPDDTLLCGLPLFHVNGVVVTGLTAFMAGAQVLLAGPLGYRNRALLEQFWRLVERFQITTFSAVPTVYAALMAIPRGEADLSSLRFGLCGAAPMPVALIQQFEQATGIRILEGYGLTEGTCISAINPRDGERRPGSIGLPIPYQQLKPVIVDDHGVYVRDCEVDEIGVLVARGPNIFPGYLQPEANQKLWLDGNWLNTGDMARRDADGYLWLTGRLKELIIRGGHNIDPAVIEEALMRHPAVQMAAAVGKPDPYAGELPVAYVVLRDGQQVSAGELIDYARRVIPERAAAPGEIYVVDSLPQTAVGKLFKPQLRYDATRRVLSTLLAPCLQQASDWQVLVGSHPLHGMQVKIVLMAPLPLRQQLVEAVKEVMAGFSLYYELAESD
ncbi:AMP-binding protein [Pokkaliibacter plantistimulans]|uniref:AMP-binding protein n=1 Tax=Pokkaliibacter plantistimulans TaxID=1635171 RepID=A0ABX5LV69_9GAMM|nr:acyl-CoA synthetase [Pokkaliibacter plantistimulans]PXF29068.1 AMP-binding protein [Pokkaliibacter plantistimulans]